MEEEAQRFLEQHNPSGEIPVPVEEIAELDFRIEIVPIPGLSGRFGIEGGLSQDLTRITVDQDRYDRYVKRYRFTIAHELGHLWLHRDYIESLQVNNKEHWKSVVKGISATDFTLVEKQAHYFAGCILVPLEPLRIGWADALELAKQRGFDVDKISDPVFDAMADWTAKRFDVSRQVVARRLRHTGLCRD